MKKITVFLTVFCLLMWGNVVWAEENDTASTSDPVWVYNDLNFSTEVEGTLSGDVTIPANIDNNAVYFLQYSSLCDQDEVTSLTLPNTMYAVQSTAITHMAGLKSVNLNDELEVICYGNFVDCPELTSLTIPAGVRVIEGSFMFCDNLREIYFTGECPVFLDKDSCFYCLPEDYVIYVPDDQFEAYTEALQDANGAADHLQKSGENAIIPERGNNEEWFMFDEETGAITGYIEYHAFVEIPESIHGVAVKSVAQEAMQFEKCIYALVLPEGIEKIDNNAFAHINSTIYIKFPSTLKTIGDEAFKSTSVNQIDWSEGLEEIGARAFENISGKTLTLPSTVKRIGESAFEKAWISELHLKGDMESIGSRAFADSSLSYLEFDFYEPIEIAEDAFVGTNVMDLDLPWDSSFENQAQYAEIFREQCPDCTVWINNPESAGVAEYPDNSLEITRIENGVWSMYNGEVVDLTVWPNYDEIPVTALGDGLFKGNQSIRSFYPHHCGWFITIGNEVFADSSLEYIEMFEGIETIGNGAFRNCKNLTELILPASLTSIGADALEGCINLQKLTVLCDPTILPAGLLDTCTALSEVYASQDATDEQVAYLTELAGYPWYSPVCREGETRRELIEMPYAELPIEDFWYDMEYTRLDRYHGYELNLYLPREAEGTVLTELGMDMMGRACGGDNYEMELPVRSVVIPENYTNISSFTFDECETLETIICYAPLEKIPSGMFWGCTNLREVVFVNGVRSVESYVFSGCENLETVYLGELVETIDENAFLNDDGSVAFDQNSCITDPALMPDVEAMLAAVKSDPMPTPEPTIELTEATPVGEEGAAYVGKWQAETIEVEGETYPASIMEMELTMVLKEDGSADITDSEATESSFWMIEDGVVIIDQMPSAILSEDGKLIMEEDGLKIFFTKTEGTSEENVEAEETSGLDVEAEGTFEENVEAEETSEPDVKDDESADLSDKLEHKYVCQSADADGVTLDASMLGGEYALTFHADGTVDFVMVGTKISGLKWTEEDGSFVIDYYGNLLEVVWTEDGLDMNYFDTMMMHFVSENF